MRPTIVSAVFLIFITAQAVPAQQLVARDSNGLVIEIKEKYGTYLVDTCTVVMRYNGSFVIVRRNGVSGYYPESFHSIRVVRSLNQSPTLAQREQERNVATPQWADAIINYDDPRQRNMSGHH